MRLRATRLTSVAQAVRIVMSSVPIELLLVAGGAAGGQGDGYGGGGGGGAGEFVESTLALTSGQTVAFSIGGGGVSTSNTTYGKGSDTVFGTRTAQGGGGGANALQASTCIGQTGGSGGGSVRYGSGPWVGGASTATQPDGYGFKGGDWATGSDAAGGGGAGGAGVNGSAAGGQGGAGRSSSITGVSTPYAGGGGGGKRIAGGATALGGSGIGGNGSSGGTVLPTAGAANTGSGGGGAGGTAGYAGAAGGSGVIVIAYPDICPALTISGAVFETLNTRPGYRVYRITSGVGTVSMLPSIAPAGVEIMQAQAFFALRVPSGTTYSGPLIKVRRTSDNTEQTFGARAAADSNGDRWLDTTAMLSFVGSSTGEVTGWYDQRTGQIATQTVAANCPKIVIAGVLQTANGLPAIRHAGGLDFWNYSNFPTSGSVMFIATVQSTATSGSVALLGNIGNSTYLPIGSSASPTNTNVFRVNGVNDPAGLESYTNGSVVPVQRNRAAQFFAIAPQVTPPPPVVWRVGAIPMSTNTVSTIGAAASGFALVGYFCELAAYPSTFAPASVLAVERNMGAVRGVQI